jgi:deoxyribose-phosphate aldolase
MEMISTKSMANIIDHSILRPNMTKPEVLKSIKDALDWEVKCVCIMPNYLPLLNDLFKDVNILKATVVGFPHGNISKQQKMFETIEAINIGVDEIDMVANISAITSGSWKTVLEDIEAVYKVCKDNGKLLKVIFENCYLNEHQKITMCQICSDIMTMGMVKTSTGFGGSGATLDDLVLMKKNVGSHIGVKASGGIKTLDQAISYYNVGIQRIGTSATNEILSLIKSKRTTPILEKE